MRLLYTILPVLFLGLAARADDAAVIAWNPARPLTWDDFRAAVPPGADRERVAASNTSLSWSYEYRVEWLRGRCAYRILRIDSAAGFHPDGSWVRPGHRTPEVLAHEQGHFAITQIYYEKFAEATRDLVGNSRECRGSSERRAKRDVEREIGELAGAVYEAVWREHQREQKAYDEETRHGIDSTTQAEWSSRLAARLR